MEYTRHRFDPRLASVLGRLSTSKFPESAQALMDRLPQVLAEAPPAPTGPALAQALAPFRWFLERGDGDGLPLTQAGYLKPAAVKEIAPLLPTMDDWIFPVTREINTRPVLGLREVMRRAGLLRKHRGALLTTKVGRVLTHEPEALWAHLAERLIPKGEGFDVDVTVLALLHIASPRGRVDADVIARLLGQLGWARDGGQPVTTGDVHWWINETWDVVGNIGPPVGDVFDRVPSPAALTLIRDALVLETSAFGGGTSDSAVSLPRSSLAPVTPPSTES